MTRAAELLIADPSLRSAVTFALESQGVRVGVYPDMARLVDECESGCLIVDIAPHEPDPVERLNELSRHHGHPPVIVLASFPSPRTHQAIEAVGATLVEKPLLTDALCTTVNRLTEPSPAL